MHLFLHNLLESPIYSKNVVDCWSRKPHHCWSIKSVIFSKFCTSFTKWLNHQVPSICINFSCRKHVSFLHLPRAWPHSSIPSTHYALGDLVVKSPSLLTHKRCDLLQLFAQILQNGWIRRSPELHRILLLKTCIICIRRGHGYIVKYSLTHFAFQYTRWFGGGEKNGFKIPSNWSIKEWSSPIFAQRFKMAESEGLSCIASDSPLKICIGHILKHPQHTFPSIFSTWWKYTEQLPSGEI